MTIERNRIYADRFSFVPTQPFAPVRTRSRFSARPSIAQVSLSETSLPVIPSDAASLFPVSLCLQFPILCSLFPIRRSPQFSLFAFFLT